MEDVADIVLNLKEVRLRLHGEGPKILRVHQKGQGVLRARDLSEDPTVEVMNPDKKVATLSADADVELEITVDTGKGYVGAEKNKSEDMPIGTIPIDSIFSPVTKVNYSVTPARVGRETDFDRLSLEIWTDGTLAPVDALAFAAKILKEQLAIFINFEEPTEAHLPILSEARAAQSAPVQVGGRARAVGALGELPPEREHPADRRARAAHRRRDAQDQELRPQVAERDQGSAREHGPRARHAARELPVARGDRADAGARLAHAPSRQHAQVRAHLGASRLDVPQHRVVADRARAGRDRPTRRRARWAGSPSG
jgi:hypothetical protein